MDNSMVDLAEDLRSVPGTQLWEGKGSQSSLTASPGDWLFFFDL